ncbi:hypothetical protein ABBQ32_013456 [Trebouxia sp. C0010 RCD-2024]
MAIDQLVQPEDEYSTIATKGLQRKVYLEPTRSQAQTHSLASVAKHNKPDDCWVIIQDKVYNVTAWVPRHPGGALIYINAGKDCTQLFDSYHPLYVRAVLDKFCIGNVVAGPGECAAVQYHQPAAQRQFYTVLRQRVDKHFRKNEISSRASIDMYVKTALILSGLVVSFWGTFFCFSSFWLSALCSVVLGVCMAEVGVSIQHDANHGAYSRNTSLEYLLGTTLDIVGASSFMWKQQHVVGHHTYTNVDGLDPDIRVKDPDVRRVSQHQPWQSYQAYQHIYLALLYGLLAIKSILLDDFQSISTGSIGPVSISKLTTQEKTVFWGGKLLWLAYFIILPAVKSHHSWAALAALWLVSEAVTGWILALMFQVAHVTPDVAFLQQKNGTLAHDWAAAQVATTADFAHGSFFWTHFSGGLNYQVVHHLFPGICHTHYPAIAPIVMDTCKEFNVPYKVYPTFWSALYAHFSHLQQMGRHGVAVSLPSLATVG